jgi:3-deoxy-D-manno-octulosonic-acid transferase
MPRNLYTALFCLLLPVYFARLCWKGLSNKEYFLRWSERLGYSSELPSKDKSVIWIHAVSVGEVNASMPLLRSLITDYPYSEILVTTTTPTGSKLLIERLGNKIKHQYLPVDIPFFINRFLNKWNPKILILLETEIWPNLINICKTRGIYSALVNARLSEKSKKNYLKYSSLIKPVIETIDLILAQFESDKRRFQEIADRKDINTCGNLKFDQDVPKELEDISETIKQDWSIDGKYRPTLIAASTHETEEEEVLKAFKLILKSFPNALLILVPRHLERFDKVKKLINTSGLTLASRSKQEEVKRSTQVLLGDTIGELNFLYSLSDVAFVGGSLIDHGGQNLLEPAAQSLALLSGPSLRNFSDISEQLIKKEGLTVIRNAQELSDVFVQLIDNPDEIKERGRAAFGVFMENRGALEKIIGYLHEPLQV